jgi:hypothetical protein
MNFRDLKGATLCKPYFIFRYLAEQKLNYYWQTEYTVQSLDRSKKRDESKK